MIDEQTEIHTSPRGDYYRIKVTGVLDPAWSSRLGGLQISSELGETILTGHIIDQAALHGLLMQIRDLGLPLLLVARVDST